MPRIIDCEQGSAEWYRARQGIPTASMFDKIITAEGKPSKQSHAYMYRLIAERLLNESLDDQIATVQWVEHGKLNEPHALAHYAFTNGVELRRVGFVTTDNGVLGCSPDALIVGRNEAVEVKCPAPHTHLGYLLDGATDKYRPQVQGQLLIGEFDKAWFYSWNARMPPATIETGRDERFISIMGLMLNEFVYVLERKYERAKSLGAYVASPSLITPAERAYGEEAERERPQLRIVVPE